jgi:hypothetical protein
METDGIAAFCGGVVTAASQIRLPALLRKPPADTLYRQPERHGVAVVAVETTHLSPDTIERLLRFRLAQYLDIGFIDPGVAYEQRLAAEPASVVQPGDIHVVAGAPATGEVLCYAVLEQPPDAPEGARLRSTDRPPYPVERIHGAGLYQRLAILPDLPVAKVRELGRFVKNQRPAAGKDLLARAVVELGAAVFRLAAGPLRLSLDAVVGDLEEHVAKQNLDFFHIPSVVVHGTVPYPPSASYLYPRYQRHAVHPFACLTSDISSALPRLRAVEEALALPGKLALLALLRLKSRRERPAPSMLHSAADHALAELRLSQRDTAMPARGELLRAGARLRECELFAPLSLAEATMLSTLMQRVEVPAGKALITEGSPGDALYFVEAGQASLEVTDERGDTAQVGSIGAGDCCGHAAILADADHCVTAVATTNMTVLRLSKHAHDTYLGTLPDVHTRLSQDALRQLTELDRRRRATNNPRS